MNLTALPKRCNLLCLWRCSAIAYFLQLWHVSYIENQIAMFWKKPSILLKVSAKNLIKINIHKDFQLADSYKGPTVR